METSTVAQGVDWSKWLQQHIKESQDAGMFDSEIETLVRLCGLLTYDDHIGYLLLGKFFTTIEHIINRTTFDYIKDEANYLDYITMVNLPRIAKHIEWGGSIRGAWFEYGKFEFFPDPLENEVDGVNYVITDQQELINYWKALIEFYKGLN